ncbi:MAG TPA: hypothetical protein VK206_11215 [Anaerolineales bacterium]|nr:hypothetical protein [Anaerolineales bacterium]
MNFRTLAGSVFSLLLFLAGVLLEIAISTSLLWGELEVRLYMPSSSDSGLKLNCPHILSFDETGIIRTSIINTLNQAVQPMVTAEISRNGGAQQISQTLTLAPHESKAVTWAVDASNVLFGRLILVSVLQGKYEDLPARQGYCGIFLLNLFGMSGRATLILLCSTSFALLSLGTAIWVRSHWPLNRRDENIARAFGSLAVLATLGLFSALLRWWGLIIILDAITLILIIVIFTDVLFNP